MRPSSFSKHRNHCEDSMNATEPNLRVEAPSQPAGHSNADVDVNSGGFDFSLTVMGGFKHTLVELHSFLDCIANSQQVLAEIGR